eukprot:TRINITY_DN4325_c1_g2_i3.p2 TRINITY_DN4325_c1_g2~~TRINITY_DN4325_c1_g2_i3.p2  ORF type:complete len:298 (+),score=93.29 TRINITY_DN4325_c1_g2_i3:155-1048(+)
MLRNYDDLGTKHSKKHRNGSLLYPQHPFRMVIVGESGCGKTNLLLNLLLEANALVYDRLYLVSPSLEQDVYQGLMEVCDERHQELLDETAKALKKKGVDEATIAKKLEGIEPSCYFYEHIDEFDYEALSRDHQNLIVFDDIMTQKNQEHFTQLFSKGRHKNASTIYLSQSFTAVPLNIRRNCSNYICFPMKSADQRNMWDISGSRRSLADITMMFKYLEKRPFHFLHVNKKPTDEMVRYTVNFTTPADIAILEDDTIDERNVLTPAEQKVVLEKARSDKLKKKHLEHAEMMSRLSLE